MFVKKAGDFHFCMPGDTLDDRPSLKHSAEAGTEDIAHHQRHIHDMPKHQCAKQLHECLPQFSDVLMVQFGALHRVVGPIKDRCNLSNQLLCLLPLCWTRCGPVLLPERCEGSLPRALLRHIGISGECWV